MARWEKNNLLLNSITNFFGAPCQDTNSSTMRNIHRRCRRDLERTRPSVNQAKVWLDHLFTFPGLIWSGKGFRLKDGLLRKKMEVISAMPERKHFFLSGERPLGVINGGHSTTIFLWPSSAWWRQPNEQPSDPSASLLLTSEKAFFCNFVLCCVFTAAGTQTDIKQGTTPIILPLDVNTQLWAR